MEPRPAKFCDMALCGWTSDHMALRGTSSSRCGVLAVRAYADPPSALPRRVWYRCALHASDPDRLVTMDEALVVEVMSA